MKPIALVKPKNQVLTLWLGRNGKLYDKANGGYVREFDSVEHAEAQGWVVRKDATVVTGLIKARSRFL